MTANKKISRNTESSLYIHTLYYLLFNGKIPKDKFEETIFKFLQENSLLFQEDLQILESRATRSNPEAIYQQLRNLAKSNKSLAPSELVQEDDEYFFMAEGIFQNIKETLLKNKKSKIVADVNTKTVLKIFCGPPGTGKTRIAKAQANVIAHDKNIIFIQFHPSYSYEDFIQGEKVVYIDKERIVQVVDGPLMIAYRKASRTPAHTKFKIMNILEQCFVKFPLGLIEKYGDLEHMQLKLDGKEYKLSKFNDLYKINSEEKFSEGIYNGEFYNSEWGKQENHYVIIIDEINRADTARVFGELLSILSDIGELSKANVHLQYSGEIINWPNNLSILGTMNSSDRSIGTLDQAFKRRFEFEFVEPDYSVFSEKIEMEVFKMLEESIKKKFALTKSIECCNDVIDSYNEIFLKARSDFGKMPMLYDMLNAINNKVLLDKKYKDQIWDVNKKLIGHSFFIKLTRLLAEEMSKDGISNEKVVENCNKIYSDIIDKEIKPQISSITSENEELTEILFQAFIDNLNVFERKEIKINNISYIEKYKLKKDAA